MQHNYARSLLAWASLLLALSCISSSSLQAARAAVVPMPGRMLNKAHEEVFAAQAKESERTKQRERKPVSGGDCTLLRRVRGAPLSPDCGVHKYTSTRYKHADAPCLFCRCPVSSSPAQLV